MCISKAYSNKGTQWLDHNLINLKIVSFIKEKQILHRLLQDYFSQLAYYWS